MNKCNIDQNVKSNIRIIFHFGTSVLPMKMIFCVKALDFWSFCFGTYVMKYHLL